MKKNIRNVLAKNSNNEIAYLCGKCGKEVKKDAVRCRHCGSRLGNIRCPFCNFTGTIEDFAKDTCPKCGRENTADNDKKTDPDIKTSSRQNKISLTHKLFWIFFIILTGLIAFLFIIFLTRFELF